MTHRKTSLVLAALLSLSLLTSCGGQSPQETDNSGGSVPPAASVEPTQAPDTPAPALPDTPAPTETLPLETDAPAETAPVETAPAEDGEIRLTLNKTDVTLYAAGKSFTLKPKPEGVPEGSALALSWSSSDESVAKVESSVGGLSAVVTAVGPGTATITARPVNSTAVDDPLTVSCIVRCRWTEESPEPSTPAVTPTSAPVETPPVETAPPTSAPVETTPVETAPPAPASADLTKFYENTMSKYEFGFLELADAGLVDNFYSGLSGIPTEQCLVYICMMSMNNGEFVLVQVKDSGDVPAVKDILQARVDSMVDGGAWYPAAIEQWELNSRVVSNGNYVMMVVHENADSIVSEFNTFTS